MAGITFCTINPKNKTVADDVAKFLSSGGVIHPIADGVSGDNKHPYANSVEFSGQVKNSASKGGKNSHIGKVPKR